MTRIQVDGAVMTVEQGTHFISAMAVAFLLLALGGVVGGALSPKAKFVDGIVPIAALAIAGIVLGRMPSRRTTTLRRGGPVDHVARTLFGTQRRSEPCARAVIVQVGARHAYLDLDVDGPPIRLLHDYTRTSFSSEVPWLRARAAEIAEFLGVPVS